MNTIVDSGMNYKRLYQAIIENARLKEADRSGIYTEKHHIVPKSLGGNNSSSNLVRLTAREHFICHWLLLKMYPKGSIEKQKMLFAFVCMCLCNKETMERNTNSKLFERYRIEANEILKKRRDIHKALERWDEFHSGQWASLSDFDKHAGRSVMTSCVMFNSSIPIYNALKRYSKYRRFCSDSMLIGVYA